MGLTNLSTKRQRIAELARTKLGVASHLHDFLDWRVTDGVNYIMRERTSSMKNRKRETCTSGSVRDEGGNILIYSASPVGSTCKFEPAFGIARCNWPLAGGPAVREINRDWENH